jgi:hypothetical protein
MLSALMPRSFEVESMSGLSGSLNIENSGDLKRESRLCRFARHQHRRRGLRPQHRGLDLVVLCVQIGDERGFELALELGQIAIARAALPPRPIMRRERSSRPATMVGASDG